MVTVNLDRNILKSYTNFVACRGGVQDGSEPINWVSHRDGVLGVTICGKYHRYLQAIHFIRRFANQVKEICGAQVEVVKRNELHKFVVLPRRWVVERLFGWLDKFRRLWKNCERKLFISAQILIFALIAILIKRF